MQFSKSTGYALHTLIHLAQAERGRYVGIKELASKQGLPESYLSKIMSKLRQDGIVRAVTGASGGYELARPGSEITFYDVISVVEGRQQMYECHSANDHQHQLFTEADAPGCECLVKKVMDGAERQMLDYLKQHTIQGVLDAASFSCSEEQHRA